MKRFRFPLESLLQARRLSEAEASRGLAEAQKKLQIEIEIKRALQSQLDQSLNERSDMGRFPTPASGFQFVQNYIIGTKQRIMKSDQAIFRANRGVEKAMRLYLQAKRLTRMIETLKDRALADFKFGLKKAEQKEQDELTIMRNHLVVADREADL